MNMQRAGKVVTSDDIVRDLLEKIVDLKIMPGELISEGDLCSAYETTRHAVRGALAIIREKGFVDVFPQRGTFVSLIDLEYINNVLYLREAIEQETVRRIIENGVSRQILEKLRAGVKKQRALKHPKDNAQSFYRLDDEFHETLLSAIGRKSLSELYSDDYMHVRRWRNMEVGTLERIEELPDEHEQIIEAIEKGDAEHARSIINHHIDSVKRYGDEVKKKHPEYFL